MKTPTAVMIALPCLLGMRTAHAGEPPSMLGIWKADLAAMSPTDTTLSRQMLRVTTLPSGFLFHLDIQSSGGETDILQPIIPDDKPHVEQTEYGPSSSTCHSADPNTIECRMSMAGSPSQTRFVLSANGSTLTETDIIEVVHEHHSAQTGADIEGTRANQTPTTSGQQQTTSTETRIVVYRRQ